MVSCRFSLKPVHWIISTVGFWWIPKFPSPINDCIRSERLTRRTFLAPFAGRNEAPGVAKTAKASLRSGSLLLYNHMIGWIDVAYIYIVQGSVLHTSVFIYIYIHMYMCVCTFSYFLMQTCMCVYVYLYIMKVLYIMYVYMHAHTHTSSHLDKFWHIQIRSTHIIWYKTMAMQWW